MRKEAVRMQVRDVVVVAELFFVTNKKIVRCSVFNGE